MPRRPATDIARPFYILGVLAVVSLPPLSAQADSDDFPLLLGSSDAGLMSTRAVASQSSARKVDTMSFLEHLKSGLFFSPAFSLQSQVTYEPLRVPLRQPHKKHVMSDEGLYLEQLYGKAEFEGLMAYGGKFDLPVSLVADTAPGIFGGDYATDYQLREMLGAGGVLHLTPREWGSHSFGIVGFAADTSLLDAAAFTQPNFGSTDTARTGRLHQGNGGEANTGAPQSKLLTLDGDGTALALPTLTYHLAWASLRHGVGETKNQIDLVGAVQYTGDLGAGVAIHPLLEASRIYNDGGSPVSSGSSIPASQRADYLTTGVELTWRSWSISAVHAQRFFIEPKNGSGLDGRSSFEHMTTEAIGYAFDWGVSTAIAWKHDHSLAPDSTLNVTTDSIGLLINYHQDF